MIVAYSRGDGAATNYEIAWVTVALQHLRLWNDCWPGDRSRTSMVADPMVLRAQLGRVAPPTSLLALAVWQPVTAQMEARPTPWLCQSRIPVLANETRTHN